MLSLEDSLLSAGHDFYMSAVQVVCQAGTMSGGFLKIWSMPQCSVLVHATSLNISKLKGVGNL